ncbi:phenylalanine--tRNA ligase subunit beta [Dietzia timorensis]|uniref:Phenylalanine--tRNA ligase beta subunit n=1 Tax=Dietzia timorensis TaxID=499555 RepID=A0A173LLU4_9ACTN|nr:phenylalanine--tRNA ligase subunit beta [Dietzia timorensis]ANI92257.1 Phenylalanine--tRNA ligase beta subunit [Dietzia timorensis]
MQIAQSWLTEILQRANEGWSVSPAELDAGFVSVGLEVEGEPEALPEITGPLVIGRVQSIEELEGFKKPIRFCHVDVGNDAPQEIVCGARNFAEGDLVVVALPGTVLPGNFEIGERVTYGKPSAGMIASAKELGIGNDHSGIITLREGTAEPGESAADMLGLDDTVIELNITPDRGYCFSARGLARELACGFDLDFAEPAGELGLGDSEEAWPVRIDDDVDTVRFAARKVTGIDARARTPWWMVKRLLTSGIRPISPAVDVTNYVMLELGHPMHAFDADALQGGLHVRFAGTGEKLVTLDDQTRTLDSGDVVICDARGPISLAGVMGGADTEVSDDTTNVLLEAAVWEPLHIFRTIRRHKLPSEAGKRYERSVDPGITIAALDRAATLLAEIAGGTVEPTLTDIGGVPEMPTIEFPAVRPDEVAGVDYPAGTSERRLRQIGCEVAAGGDGVLSVTPPSWRTDLRMNADLVEEVLRLEGLESIPSILPQAPSGRGLTASQRSRRAIGHALAYTGHVEVIAFPFLNPSVFDAFGLDADDPRRNTMELLNPLDAEQAHLATTLLPPLVDVARRNLARGRRSLSMFSISQVTRRTSDTRRIEVFDVTKRPSNAEIEELNGSLPYQPLHVATLYSGERAPAGHWGAGRDADALDAVEAAREVARGAGVDIEIRAAQYAPWHPGRCAEIIVRDERGERIVGHAGELHPAVLERLELPKRTSAMEINLTELGVGEVLPAPEISAYPAVLQDVAVVVDADVPSSAVRDALAVGAGELCESVELFDVFTGEQVGEGKKSLAYALSFRAADRTLTEDEASEMRDSAVRAAGDTLGAVLRG